MKKKIAVIDLLFRWPPDGGARTDIKEITQRLAGDFEVCLFAPAYDYHFPRGQILESLDFPVKILPISRAEFHGKGLTRAFKKAVDQFNPDVVFIADALYTKPRIFHALKGYRRVLRFYAYESLCLKNFGLFTFRQKLCRRFHLSGIKDHLFCQFCCLSNFFRHRSWFFIDDYVAGRAFSPFFPEKVRQMLREADTIICYNTFIKKLIDRYNPNTRLTPSGIDPELFSFQPVPRQSPGVILIPGRVNDPLKGFPFLLKACRKLYNKRKDFKVKYTARFPVKENLPFLEHVPWRPMNQLPSLYHESTICVVPSIWPEPFGIVALEDMATGRPLIVTNVGGLGQIFDHGKEGYIIEPNNVDQMVFYLEHLLDDHQKCREMGEQGRKKVLQQYTWDHIYEKYYRKTFRDL